MRKPAAAFSLILALLGGVASSAEPRIILDTGTLAEGRFARGSLVAEGSLPQAIRLVGRTWEGRERILFESRRRTWSRSQEFAFLPDADLRSIRVETREGPGGWAAGEVLDLPLTAHPPPPFPELPFHLASLGEAPERIRLGGGDLRTLAKEASDRLFVTRAPLASVGVLGILLAAFAALPLLGAHLRIGAVARMLTALGLAIAACAMSLILLPDSLELRTVSLGGREGGGAGDAELILREGKEGGIDILTWGGASGTILLGIRTPPGQALPLALLGEGRFRFDPEALVIDEGGGPALSFPRYALGWRLGDDP